jgi:hypothetical protein
MNEVSCGSASKGNCRDLMKIDILVGIKVKHVGDATL